MFWHVGALPHESGWAQTTYCSMKIFQVKCHSNLSIILSIRVAPAQKSDWPVPCLWPAWTVHLQDWSLQVMSSQILWNSTPFSSSKCSSAILRHLYLLGQAFEIDSFYLFDRPSPRDWLETILYSIAVVQNTAGTMASCCDTTCIWDLQLSTFNSVLPEAKPNQSCGGKILSRIQTENFVCPWSINNLVKGTTRWELQPLTTEGYWWW